MGRTEVKREADSENDKGTLGPARDYCPPLTISRPDFTKSGSDEEFRESVYLLVQALDRLLACREAFGRSIGLTPSQFAVLIGTAYCQGTNGVTIRALAEHVALAQTHVTTEVGRLIRRGLLVKHPNAADRRSVLVSLTPAGEQAVEAVAPLVREANDHLFAGISPERLATVTDFARQLISNGEFAAAAIRANAIGGVLDE